MYIQSIAARHSVRDFLAVSLLRWLFNEEYPLSSAKYAAAAFVRFLINAAQAKDYVETISCLDPELPGEDILFWRFCGCTSFDRILGEYTKTVKRNIKAVERQIRWWRFIIAIDETMRHTIDFTER